MFVTFFDTCMVSLTAIFVWRLSPFLVFFPWLTIACLDGTFISSALTKVPDGAWVTIMIALIMGSVFLVWRFGKEQQWFAEAEDRYPTSYFIQQGADNQLFLTQRFHGDPLSHIRGFGIFFDKVGETTPTVFSQFTTKLTAIPEIMVFFHLRPLELPSVAPESRYSVSRLAIPNCYRLVVRYGYNDEVVSPNLASVVYQQIRSFRTNECNAETSTTPVTALESDSNDDTIDSPAGAEKNGAEVFDSEVTRIDNAYVHKVLYIIGKEQLKIKPKTSYFRRFLLFVFLWIRENTRAKMANLNVPMDKVIEVGFLKEI